MIDLGYCNTTRLIRNVSAIETDICYREIKFDRVYLRRFSQTTINDYQNITLNFDKCHRLKIGNKGRSHFK